MEARTRLVLVVLVALCCYGCMFYYVTDEDKNPHYTPSHRNPTLSNANTTLSNANSTLPNTNSTLPNTNSTLLNTKSTLPNTKSTLPNTNSTLPNTKSTLPNTKSTLPNTKGTLPNTKGTLPNTNSTLPNTNSTLPNTNSTLPNTNSTLPNTKGTLPNTNSTFVHFNANSTSVRSNTNGPLKHLNSPQIKQNSTFKQLNSSRDPFHNSTSIKKIIFWNPFFGNKEWNHIFLGKQIVYVQSCNVNCSLATNKESNPLEYDLLVFHGRDPQNPPKKRLPHQVYLMLLMESPVHRENAYIKGDYFYNWSATYSRKSDFLTPYLHYQQVPAGQAAKPSPVNVTTNLLYKRQPGEAAVSWIVSNCRTSGRREEYVKELQKHITVDIFGLCGRKCMNGKQTLYGEACYDHLARRGRKFYLAFENSACRDYITEKAVRPLQAGMVPVVYGGLGVQDYLTTLPPGSFINTRNFTSPKHLADYLTYLDHNDTAYLAYHTWRGQYELGGGPNTWCQVCQALHNTSIIPHKNINWDKFWNPVTDCDTNLLSEIGGPALAAASAKANKAKG